MTNVCLTLPGYPASNFHNFTGSNLSNWAAAKIARAQGTRNVKVIDWSDSQGAGFGGAPSNINSVAFSRTAQLSPLLGNASISSFFSDHNVLAASGVPLGTFDSRIVLGTWAGGQPIFGGLALGNAIAGTLTFTPVNPVDTFDVYYAVGPGFGTVSYQIDAGSVTNFDENLSLGVIKVTASAALGVHTLKFAWVSGFVAVVGVIAYNSAAKEFTLINAGYCGATSNNLTDTTNNYPWLNAAMVTSLAPDLTLIEGGQGNDIITGVPRATALTNLQTMITTAKLSGDAILTTICPLQSSLGVPYALQQSYVDDMIALATSNGIPCIDIWRLFGGTWEIANANGLMFDGLHPNGAGYAKIATYLNRAMSLGFKSNP